MRTNIEISDDLMAAAKKATGMKTKRAAIEECIRRTTRMAAQRELLGLMGKVKWVGDLDEMRRD